VEQTVNNAYQIHKKYIVSPIKSGNYCGSAAGTSKSAVACFNMTVQQALSAIVVGFVFFRTRNGSKKS
jgi:DNA mismatch repair protein MutL